MTDSAALQFHLDSPASWGPAAADLVISGWLYPGEGTVCLDLRAKIDGRPFLGIYGLDRPDLAQAFGGSPAAGRAGFLQRVTVWRGARELMLEWHDGRDWREFFRTDLDTSSLPASARRPKPVLRAAVVYQTLQYLYRHFHRAGWRTLCRETDAVLREVLTPTSDTARDADFPGFLENPGYWTPAGYGKFRITGWMFGVDQEIRQLSATTGVATDNRLVFPKDRPDVAAHRTDHPQALHSGYYGLVDIRDETPSPANLKLFAHTGEGPRTLVLARRMYLDRRDEHSGPVPIYRPALFAKVVAAFLRGALLGRFRCDSWRDARAEITHLQQHLAGTLGRGDSPALPAPIVQRRDQDPYTRWCWHNRLTPRLRTWLQREADALVQSGGPLISVVVPAYNTPARYLNELLDSLRRQLYPRWELCIADDASPQPHVREILEAAARADPRIKPVFRPDNGHIARATNSALEVATGEFVALLDHDDLLPDDSLLHVARAIVEHPTVGYLYTDEDKIDDQGRRFDPQFKGAWSRAMALTHNYTHHLSLIRRSLVIRVGGLRPECNGAQDIDLFLRCWELLEDRDILHVPHLGYHWRAHAESTATRGDQKGYLFDAARRGIAEALARQGRRAEPFLPRLAEDYALCLHQLRWSADLLRENPVTIVIPTKDRADLLGPCLDAIARTTPRDSVSVVVVDDGSTAPDALALLAALPARPDLRAEVVRAPASGEGFNYSRLVNLGTARATTPLVLHLNNDVTALEPGWLEDMVGWMSLTGTGVVGAKLLYPDGTVNHAGISLGREDGLPHVLFERQPADDLGTQFLPHVARHVVAVTGACLLTRTDLYRQLGGFDEVELAVAYNDVDYCLRAAAAGWATVFTPQAVLQHVGSATRGRAYAEAEHVAYLRRHGTHRDPYHSEALDFPPRHLPLNPYFQPAAHAARPFHALVFTHNLNLEGAPIFIFELARHLAALPGVKVTVVAPTDGPLRARYAAEGLPVEIWDVAALTGAAAPAVFNKALQAFAPPPVAAAADVFVANTLLSWWVGPLAARLEKAVAFYLHESSPVARFFAAALPPPMHALVEAALTGATRVIFTARATRAIHESLNTGDNFRTVPSWVDFDRIEAFRAAHDRLDLRRRHGLDPDAIIVVNIGSICERKGQHIFIRGLDLLRPELAARYPGRKIQWVMVGAREGLYMETLREDIQLMGLQEVVIFPETPAIYDFYHLADLLVCTSFEESFPRVLLEAMVFGPRIVSTDVNGIAEMLTHSDEAWLVPAGDPHKLAAALRGALDQHVAGDTKMMSMARARAARHYHHARVLHQHLRLVREAWLG
jgi:O-antigen biosynthesis protein